MRKKGFGVIEVIIIIALIAIITAIAVPWYMNSLDHRRLRAAMSQVEADLRNAQQKSKAASIPYEVLFIPGDSFYRVFEHPADKTASLVEEISLPEGVKIYSNTAPGNKIVYFQPTYTSETTGGTITLQSPKGSRGQVVVAAITGRISLSP